MIKIILSLMMSSLIFVPKNEFHANGEFSIVGIWQVNSSKVGSALHDYYQFYNDGTFTYNFDQYDDTKRVMSISGRYKASPEWITFTVLSRKELTEGEIVRGSPGFQKGWVLDEAKQVTFNENYTETVEFSVCDSSIKFRCIKIANEKFYKLSDNPDDPNFK